MRTEHIPFQKMSDLYDCDVTISDDRDALRAELVYLAKLAGGRPLTVLGSGVLPYDADPSMVRFAQELAATL